MPRGPSRPLAPAARSRAAEPDLFGGKEVASRGSASELKRAETGSGLEGQGRRGGEPVKKSATAFRTISEVSAELDVPAHVLRFWETKFAQIKPMKRAGGRRYYRPEDLQVLRGIRGLLYEQGYTIRGVQKLVREGGVKVLTERVTANDGGSAPRAEVAKSGSASGRPSSERASLAKLLAELEELKRLLDSVS